MRMRGDVALRGGSKGEGKRANSADLGLQKAKNPALSVSQAFIQVSGFGTAYEKAQSTCLFKEDENKVRMSEACFAEALKVLMSVTTSLPNQLLCVFAAPQVLCSSPHGLSLPGTGP
ncbi:hypothetical protein MJG53_005789 [Ovis ammon polii x Ovis aries]|uniref:Uncharacterized protein n=1 Tax=Ovis ammon polii x Ovis aries TaxID=2918886 RepID=A0ACB9V7Z3_9CETA|nr:hypothetical protein MJG53_005789 [Ovis ammon polii x Ovis aries]